MGQAMIFHHPMPISSDPKSGSEVRPKQMIEAFHMLGYDVEQVTGYGKERSRSIVEVLRNIKNGKIYDFVYAESGPTPTLLSEPHHLPIYPCLDFNFLGQIKSYGIPIGMFYRDLHWRFERYRQAFPWYKRAMAILFHWYDWFQYKRLVDWLFLPSLRMQKALPSKWGNDNLSALPPGGKICGIDGRSTTFALPLRLFYVGGITPPLYDLRPMFNAVAQVKGIELVVCCREEEWIDQRSYYPNPKKSNVQIVHAYGSALSQLYQTSHVFALIWQPYEYLDFAMPVKLFEALGHSLPIITLEGTESARFVAREDVGWVVSDMKQFHLLLIHLRDHPKELIKKQQHCQSVRQQHRWIDRGQAVVDLMKSMRKAVAQ
jgi:hypothetical protein